MTLYSSRPWTTCLLSCHNPTWNALGKRTVPCTFFSSKSRLQWEQIIIAQDSAPLVRMTSSSRLLIPNGSNCEIAWESLMVWKLETCLTLQKIGKHRRQSAGAWQTADPVPDPSTVQSTRPQRHQKMSTRFIKARTFQHLFVPHKTPKPIQTLRFCWGRKRNARPQPCVRIWSVEHANVEETKRMDLGIFHYFFSCWPGLTALEALWQDLLHVIYFSFDIDMNVSFVVCTPSNTSTQHHDAYCISTFPHKMLSSLFRCPMVNHGFMVPGQWLLSISPPHLPRSGMNHSNGNRVNVISSCD